VRADVNPLWLVGLFVWLGLLATNAGWAAACLALALVWMIGRELR